MYGQDENAEAAIAAATTKEKEKEFEKNMLKFLIVVLCFKSTFHTTNHVHQMLLINDYQITTF